ncbi:DEAD-domain-containing protein [Suillus ampliporus]|nr:DEAD-domain-containing protein [Suillus ampliporus]
MADQAGPSSLKQLKKPRKNVKHGLRLAKTKKLSEKQQIEALERAAMEFVSDSSFRIAECDSISRTGQVPRDGLQAFADLPISESSKKGLKKSFFVNMTDIQATSIPVSLKGKDVLAAARTGSGKTLAFLIPTLEILYRRKWGPQDGLGAVIISPTRELAVQIFDVLRSVGAFHTFSAGLVIGGKNLKDEKERLARMNILVATPGRLLQHMDQTFGFECDNLQLLILDEADRILDMGFAKTLSALLSHLPKSRQTLLFSATQTQSVSQLARLSLKDPVHIGVDEASNSSATPSTLAQYYSVCTLDKKLDVLWSFIKTHLNSKVLVFLSTGKQVRFVFETFCKMHPGIPLLHLHGKQKQSARLTMYTRFTSSQHAVLFATDIAARGLDFPSVDWVVQVDAPEDADTYIHRVGRTARYESSGNGLLLLMPSEEEGMKAALEKKSIKVDNIKIRPSKTQSVQNQLQKLCFQEPEIKYLGQRAFVSYVRSVHLYKDKSIFKVNELPVEKFAEALGLPGAPKIKFLNKDLVRRQKNASRTVAAIQAEIEAEVKHGKRSSNAEDEDDSEEAAVSSDDDALATADLAPDSEVKDDSKLSTKPGVRTKYDRMFERKNQNILSAHYSKLVDHGDAVDDDEDFITLKRSNHDLSDTDAAPEIDNLSKRKLKLSRTKRAVVKYGQLGHKLIFDDEGNPHEIYEMVDPAEFYKGGLEGAKEAGKAFVEGEKDKLKGADVVDKMEAKDKKREKKRKRKDREKGVDRDDDEGAIPELAPHDDDGYMSPEFDLPSEDDVEDPPPPLKRSKRSVLTNEDSKGLEDEEELALQLLRNRR